MGLRYTPLDSVGLYVPGGTGAYPSTIVMNAVPAKVAGVPRIAAVTPPGPFRSNPHVAAAFVELGIREVYTIGGAQAVAALAYGTETIPRVNKIVGPGNMFVAVAKKQLYGNVDIDMIAGPSEIVVVADNSADPDYVAADLLSQAEHGSGREMAVLITTSVELAEKVRNEIYRQVDTLQHADDIKNVLEQNACIIVENLDQAADAVNRIAPEHLELMVEDYNSLLGKIRNAGAIFLGQYSPEPISDYYGGTNHVLPTSGAARYASPLGVYDFQKASNVVEYNKHAVYKCCGEVTTLARAEGFEAHARSVAKRCKDRL
jgi:histidinol dehydrogenase